MRSGPLHASFLLDPAFPYGEDLLQFIWEQGLYEARALLTTDGREVQVLKPGRIQRNSGPDLSDAQVRIDGQLWAGTVEVHLRSSEWNAHGHNDDPAYENVVLHVVYEHDSEVRTLSGRELPTIELLPRISTERIGVYRSLMRSKGFVPCAQQLTQVNRLRTSAWLERVLIERLERKTVEVESLFKQLNSDPAELMYHMLARAFGLKVNAEPFGMLAHALPLKAVLKYRDDALRTEALLFGQAGLLQVDFVDDYPRALQQEHRLLAGLHGLRPAPVAAWKFARMRPINLPTVRIAQLAQLLMRCEGGFGDLLATDDPQALRALLDVEAPGYWREHYVFDKPSDPRPKRLGTAGADHIIINAIVPALFALGRLLGRVDFADRAMSLLERMPAERNTLLDGWAALGLAADTAARGQALIELKNSYCTKRRCLHCGIGQQLLKGNG
ncbi:MAG TPA: DUF2851 family protein [Flavobacteriales bacterium]|nr:DUF2851 family protein [Flavobacteriales bacterium]